MNVFSRLLWASRPRSAVAAEWEWYARRYLRSRKPPAHYLGDEWNTPEVIGVDVAAKDVVRHLDEVVFSPFLGKVDSLLEIGAGGGRFTEVLIRKARHLIAADTSPTMLQLLRERFRSHRPITYLLLDGFGLAPIADQSLDAAFSYDVFVHLSPWETYLYMTELRRVLRPGGRAVVHHANTFSELGWQRFLRDVQRARQGEQPQARFSVMTPEMMRMFAERAGLRVVEAITHVVRRDCITLVQSPS